MRSPLFDKLLFNIFIKDFIFSEKQRYAPYARKSYDCEYNTAYYRRLTAEYPADYIKLKKSY